MDRIAILPNEHGEFAIAADEPAEVFIVDPSVKSDRVYLYESCEFGPEHVRRLFGGHTVGHAHDGILGEGDGTGRRPPSTPSIRPII